MSHLNRIQTSINNTEILQKTLNDLGFKYEYKIQNNNNETKVINLKDIIIKQNDKEIFTLSWDGQQYSLLVDLQFWNLDTSYERLLDKITQQYSYNSIIKESVKYGFTNINEELLEDGSLRVMLQRWN